MKLICKLIGHKYIQSFTYSEKPYEGNYISPDGKKPREKHTYNYVCTRCMNNFLQNYYLHNYEK